ncbi:hypothetical protein [Pseudomonas sp. CC6-YY-74]|uniref:hypothetical protein n=1 Tax=Pseudomonas sp. CC6-YY-74 TaxID=1930532 RepID=UPI0012ABDF77|nr:hypothetical protein [Pseudomonas sp. CC6-YY-74]
MVLYATFGVINISQQQQQQQQQQQRTKMISDGKPTNSRNIDSERKTYHQTTRATLTIALRRALDEDRVK